MTPTNSAGRIETLNGVPVYFEVHGGGEQRQVPREARGRWDNRR
jgi:hypothetical protein